MSFIIYPLGRIPLRDSDGLLTTAIHNSLIVPTLNLWAKQLGDTNMGSTSLFTVLDIIMQLTTAGLKAEEILAEVAEQRANGADEQAVTQFLQDKYEAQAAATLKAIEDAEAEESVTPAIQPSDR